MMEASRLWNAPNLVTASRLLLAPFIIREIVHGHGVTAFVLLALAAATDLADGWLARSTAGATESGQILDPIADKILLSGVFLALAYIHSVPVWFVLLVLGRDIYLLTASSVVVKFTGVAGLRPSAWGKVSTILQLATAGLFVCGNAFPVAPFRPAALFAVWPTALFTGFSGAHYTWRGLQAFRGTRKSLENRSRVDDLGSRE